ncbi:metal ABC transporter ATP-binding protein [Streptococcus gallolyticus]|uniref:metal ABC transporter ATP-binding protein n=1 Tax=Streptococcus hepaticus TaxID=3349163 RepID=UPI001C94133A|nr:metal ABC transporter ATP-binding protein [Streptococcus gallolyticus]MBY5040659.1 metal ABC transporter ATP-binding protein [Streptococcus gallolyticus]
MKTVLEMQEVSLTYGAVSALENVNLIIPQGSRTAIVGPNGAGKSSLMKAILGLEGQVKGKVSLLGQSEQIAQLIQKELAYIPQASQVNWQFPATVFEIVLMGRYAHINNWLKRPGKKDREIVEVALERMNLQDLRHRQIDQLSGGQRQRVFIARALAQEAQIYLMDEPLAGIDQLTETIIMDTLKEFQAEGKTSIVIHHDLTTVADYFDYLVWLNRTVLASGPVEKVLTTENYQTTYGVVDKFFLTKEGK